MFININITICINSVTYRSRFVISVDEIIDFVSLRRKLTPFMMSTFDFSSLCRICLAKKAQMISLNSSIIGSEDDDQNSDIFIIDMLSTVLNISTKIHENYPHFICSMCLEVLKKAYDLRIVFDESHQILQQCLGVIDEEVEEIRPMQLNTSSIDSKASAVEIIAGPNRYDLHDLIIIEEEHMNSDEMDFQGFLKNLGKSISASFVDNSGDRRKQSPSPVIEIHKLTSDECADSPVPSSISNTKHRSNSIDQYILVDGEEIQGDAEEEDIKYLETDIEHLESVDKDLIQSAMSLKFECALCKKIYASELRYKKHMKICNKKCTVKDKKGQEISILECQYCKRIFKQQKLLTYHIKVAHKTPFFTCEICNVRLKTKSAYSYHKQSKHTDANHICQYCGKRFTTSTSLKVHLESHSRDTARCVCPVCGKTFHYKGGLFYHMKQHTNERKYQCEYCDRNFYTLTAKQRHTRTHTGVRPYECRFCEKRFFSGGERKRHEYIHTGTLPYHCQYCDKGFTSKFNLKMHWFIHSGDHACDYCDRRFIANEVLQFHCKMKHRDVMLKDDE